MSNHDNMTSIFHSIQNKWKYYTFHNQEY